MVVVNTKERKVTIHIKRAKDGRDFNFEDLTQAQKDEFTWDLSQLQSDGSFYKVDNFIRANISTYTESFTHSGSNIFTLAFTPTNFLFVQKADSEGRMYDVEYTWDLDKTLTVISELSTGDKIKTLYEHFIIQP